MEPPDCPFCGGANSGVERIGEFWFCGCCARVWKIGQKRPPEKREPKVTINGVPRVGMDWD